MWKAAFLVYTLSALCELPRARRGLPAITPQDCSLDCIQQGGPGCEYCRITRGHIQKAVGVNSITAFGSCIPWPCFDLLGKEDPQICRHFVQAPNNVTVEFARESDPVSDTVVVSWKPSYYGIAFLRGFQVSLQALGGSSVACQLFLFHRNLSLPSSHAERVYKSDPFPGLSLDSQYAVTVMALPVPEEWERFYHSKVFSTRSCAEKNGLEQCKKDWYPKDVKVQQGTAVNVTFNLAPPSLGIRSYFLLCYANGMKKYTVISPNLSKNKTHHSYQLTDLQEGTNYTCQIAANEVDAVRRTFNIHVMRVQKEGALSSRTVSLSLVMIFPLFLTVAAITVGVLAALTRKRTRAHIKKLAMEPVLASYEEQSHRESSVPEEAASVARNTLTPPRLLICYSRRDGPAHVNAVMRLGAFIQQHMAAQVSLDLWETLSVAREGSVAWYCRHIRESDFVLVVCSRGLGHRPAPPEPESADEDEEAVRGLNFESDVVSSDAAVQLIEGEVVGARARGQDLSKYMVALFEYSKEADIPPALRLVPQYTLTTDLELLFSHLHGIALHKPGSYLKINSVTEEGFTKLPAGAALQQAIWEARTEMRVKNRQPIEGGD